MRARLPCALIVTLCLAHVLLYALLLPPWGIVDEQQHFDYARRLLSGDGAPHLGQTYISQPLADAVYASERWSKFGWASPPNANPATWGLEGFSYEGHQPRLYYGLLAGVLGALRGSITDELYVGRCLTGGLSLIVMVCLRRTLLTLWPRREQLVLVACLVLAVTPGFAAAMARVNNDGLAGAIGAMFSLVATRAALDGLTRRRAICLGLLLCAALATKLTAAFLGILLVPLVWHRRRDPGAKSNLAVIAGLLFFAGIFVVLQAIQSSSSELGMDWNSLKNYQTPQFGLRELVKALVNLFTSFWIAGEFYSSWRHGPWADAAWGDLAFWSLLGLLGLATATAIGKARRRVREHSSNAARGLTVHVLWLEVIALTVIVAAGSTVALTFLGLIPAPHGRFLLPYVVLCVSLIVAMFGAVRLGKLELVVLAGLLAVVDVAWFWDQELLAVYANSAYAMNRPGGPPVGTWALLRAIFADKPSWTMPAAGFAFLLYFGSSIGLVLQVCVDAWNRRGEPMPRRSPA